jgi:hypothetical protein
MPEAPSSAIIPPVASIKIALDLSCFLNGGCVPGALCRHSGLLLVRDITCVLISVRVPIYAIRDLFCVSLNQDLNIMFSLCKSGPGRGNSCCHNIGGAVAKQPFHI